MRKYRIEIAVITEELEFDEVGKLRDHICKLAEQVDKVKEGISSSVEPFKS